MTKMVNCVILGEEVEALTKAPYPGELGQRILDNVSKDGWKKWMGQQTILINEHRINVVDPKGRAFLEEQMQRFFFGDGGDMPEGFTPVEK